MGMRVPTGQVLLGPCKEPVEQNRDRLLGILGRSRRWTWVVVVGCQDDWAIGWRVAGGGVLRVLTFRGKLQGSPCAWRSVHVWGQSRRGGCRRAGAQACEG